MRESIEGLSPRQADAVRHAYAFLLREGRPPTVRELARAMGVTHNAVAFSHDGAFLAQLLRKGWAERESLLARAWRLKGVGWETVGDGQGGTRRIPFCTATPEGIRLAIVLAAPMSKGRRRGPRRRFDRPLRAG